MALKDMMKDMANAAVSQAQGAVQDAMERDTQAAKSGGVSGMMGRYTEMSADAAQKDYGMYLMRGESFTRCFALVRDKMLFTDRRIIFIDHAELSFAYITSPYFKVQGVQTETKTLEFPKGFDAQGLYSLLSELAYENVRRINA